MYKKIMVFAVFLLLLNIPIFANENITDSENIMGFSKENYKIVLYAVEILAAIIIIWISISSKKKNIKKIVIEKEIEKRSLIKKEIPKVKERVKPKFMTRADLQKMKVDVEKSE